MTEETFNQQITLSLRRVEALWQNAQELLKLPGEPSQSSEEFSTQPQKLLMESLTELSHSLQELQFAAGELHQQNEQLVESRRTLEAERQRYQELFNFAPDGYLVTDLDATIVEANQAAARLLNVSPELLVGTSLVVFVATQERRDFYYKLSQLQQGESITNWHVQIQPRGGDSCLASFRVAPIQNSSNQVVGLRWRLEDLPATRHRESTEQQSKNLFCSMVERAAIGIAILDSQGRVINSNQMLREMVGCDSEALQTFFPKLMNLDKPGVESAMFHQLLTGQRSSYQVEKHLDKPEASVEWGRLTVALVSGTDAEPTCATCIFENITEQKQIKAAQQAVIKQQQDIKQQALKQLEASQKEQASTAKPPPEKLSQNSDISVEQMGKLLNEILSNSSDFFFICDRSGKYIYVNPTAAKALGLAQGDLIGKTWQELNLSAQIAERLDAQQETVLTIGQFITDEASLTTVEGVRDYEYKITRLSNTNGNDAAVVVTFKDITQEKQAAVAASEALAKEAEFNALKSHFAKFTSAVTQELRNPLNSIFSYAKVLESNHLEGNNEQKSHYLQRIQIDAKRINQLLNDLLLVKKIEIGELRLNPTWIDLTAFCNELVHELQQSTFSHHQITFVSQCQRSGMYDEKVLRRILTNLLLNAMQYSPEGSKIQFELVCPREQAVFRIQDFGIGIPEKDQRLLFKAFHRGSNVGAIAGSGLGLYMVKQCVDLEGATIGVESQVGVGTTFTVTLPLKQQPVGS
ncbi:MULTISPECIES: PAS domain S-box protein [unclassified Coleofasciculus]|uniref:sensor histidine kinase n=1 Tax=unclassified Coleofasciculus TaxID=2692782 RepID=UPI00187EE6D3|nr:MULTISPECIES: PAS domain S-box protein [unclassified Coleofasciculus]MBE9125937.1 PAS domain S-box protein [Coleofasciculus sp. LEGE 07081]MBE9149309.1 PAS domain S-box protein [Coleofasciculus sp. LEGE 07092]